MSDYTPEEFNEAMARLDGRTISPQWKGGPNLYYYSDLNLLMPLAWKHGVILQSLTSYSGTTNFDKFIQNTCNYLWAIAKGE